MKPQTPTATGAKATPIEPDTPLHPGKTFKLWRLIAFVLFLLLAISLWMRWYTGAVSLPRYCDNPAETLHYLKKVLTEDRPAQESSRRPYIIAAKLIYLIPRQRDEALARYLQRLNTRIAEQCR